MVRGKKFTPEQMIGMLLEAVVGRQESTRGCWPLGITGKTSHHQAQSRPEEAP